MATIPQIEFVKGIPPELEHDSCFDAGRDNWANRQPAYKGLPSS